MPKVFASIVYHNSLKTHSQAIIKKSLLSLLQQEGFELNNNLIIRLCDNASNDNIAEFINEEFKKFNLEFKINKENLGFSGAHNQAVFEFLNSDSDYLLIINPDLYLYSSALKELIKGIEDDSKAGLASAKLFRGDSDLNLTRPAVLDSAGMILTSALRHFDRGSNEEDMAQWDKEEYVFGTTGACLLIKRQCVKDTILPKNKFQADLYKIYPQLECKVEKREELFDEAFFAYREDADLCWRAKHFGWACKYVPSAKGIHRRVVLPSNRQKLDAKLNLLSVRNRFLLQINNYFFFSFKSAFFKGLIFRNILVILGVFIFERTSLRAFKEVYILSKRALLNREYIRNNKNGL